MLPDPTSGTEKVPNILGHYRLLGNKLGKGNYATVVEATHLYSEVRVAIKIIDTSEVHDDYVLRHLGREAALLRRLSHPNIVAVFGSITAGPLHCLVTELVKGGELSAFVTRQPRAHLDEDLALRFGAQLVSAIAHMHARGVVHRDLKMKNILLNRSHDTVKIVDFGLSNIWSPDCPLRTHCGSPGYAAPEIYVLGKAYGPEVDMWSLGVVLFGMAVGRLPFPSSRDKSLGPQERRARLMAQIGRGASEAHARAMGHLSPHFRDLVSRLLVAAPEQRMTIKEAVLHPWLAGMPNLDGQDYRLTARESDRIIDKISKMLNIPVAATEAHCSTNRLSDIASLYNILAHLQLSARYALRKNVLREVASIRSADEGADTIFRTSLTGSPETCDVQSTDSTPRQPLTSKCERKPRLPRLTFEPISIISIPPTPEIPEKADVSNDPTATSPRRSIIRPSCQSPHLFIDRSRSTSIRTTGPEVEARLSDATHRPSNVSAKPPKSVSFCLFPTNEQNYGVRETDSDQKYRTEPPKTFLTRKVDCAAQTSQNDILNLFISRTGHENDSNISHRNEGIYSRREADENKKTEFKQRIFESKKASNESLSKKEFRKKGRRNITRSAPALMRVCLTKTRFLLFTKVRKGSRSSKSKLQVATPRNEHTLAKDGFLASGCSNLAMNTTKAEDVFRTTAKKVPGSCQPKLMMKPTCPRHTSCSTDSKDSGKTWISSNQTDYKSRFKKWRQNNRKRWQNVFVNRCMVDLTMENAKR